MATATLDHVLLSHPTHLSEMEITKATAKAAPQSWMQVAKTGNFVSQRYGKFSITSDDLSQMLKNFKEITPKAPTALPVDYDHLSMDPQRPGDGKAAGWIKDLEMRGDEELWGLVEWTPEAAEHIRHKHYQFVSPSFVKDYVYKDGKTIGTTLLAAAITNHPFLEGMAALTLSAGLMKELALMLADDEPPADTPPPADEPPSEVTAVEVGQKVSVKDEEVQKPEQQGVVFTVAQVVGSGADAFVSLEAPDGTIAEWFRADELAPAPASDVPPADNPFEAAAPPPPATPVAPVHARRSKMSSEFKLTDKDGHEIVLSDDIVNAIIAKAVPAGSVVVKTEELAGLKNEVTSLTSQVATMAETAATAQKRARTMEMAGELDRLSKGGFITKVERTWAEKTFAEQVDLSGFKEWAATKTVPIVKLNHEHGTGLDTTAAAPAAEAQDRLMNLAMKIQKEKRVSYRDALILASRQEAGAAETYREQFMPTH